MSFNIIADKKKPAYEVLEILKTTYGDAALSQATVYQWYAAFRSSNVKGGPGALCTKLTDRTVNTAAAIMQDDAQIMVRGLAHILQITVSSAHHLLTEILSLSRMCACWIPRLLMVEHN